MLFCDEKCDLTYRNSNKYVQYNLEKIFCPSCKNRGFWAFFGIPGRPLPAPVVPLPAGSRREALSGASTEDRPAGQGAGRTDLIAGPCDRQREAVQRGQIVIYST